MTRLYTVLGRASAYDGVLSVWRVQTPLLGLIVRRDLEIEQFVPRTYFTIHYGPTSTLPLRAPFLSHAMAFCFASLGPFPMQRPVVRSPAGVFTKNNR